MAKALHPAQELLKKVVVKYGLSHEMFQTTNPSEPGPFDALVFAAHMVSLGNPKILMFACFLEGDILVLNRFGYDVDLKEHKSVGAGYKLDKVPIEALSQYMEIVENKNPEFSFGPGEDEDGIYFNMRMEYPLSRITEPFLAHHLEIYLKYVVAFEGRLLEMNAGVEGPPDLIPELLQKEEK